MATLMFWFLRDRWLLRLAEHSVTGSPRPPPAIVLLQLLRLSMSISLLCSIKRIFEGLYTHCKASPKVSALGFTSFESILQLLPPSGFFYCLCPVRLILYINVLHSYFHRV